MIGILIVLVRCRPQDISAMIQILPIAPGVLKLHHLQQFFPISGRYGGIWQSKWLRIPGIMPATTAE